MQQDRWCQKRIVQPEQVLLVVGFAIALASCAPAPELVETTDPSEPTCTPGGGPDFSGHTLINEDFTSYPAGALIGANFNGADLSGAVFTGQDLSGATFENANLSPTQSGPASFAQADLTQACFIGAVMNETDFNFAEFSCTDFTGTSLMQADFGPAQTFLPNAPCRTRFIEATLDIAAIDTANWGQIDFSYTRFQNVAEFSLAGKDITGAILVGAEFSNMDMTGSNLTQVDFTSATLTGANLENAALNAAVLVDAHVDFANLTCARFYYQAGDSTDQNAAFCPATPATSVPATGANLQGAVLTSSVMRNATLDYALLNQANLSGVDFTLATFRQASLEATGNLNSATIAGTTFTNSTFDSAQLSSVVFTNSNLQGASFAGTSLAQTSFSGAIMPDTDFTGAVLESVNFSNTILQNATFAHTTLKTVPNGGGSGVTFSCAQLGGADFTDATVTQATFANAVMPGASDCCPPEAGFTWCGTIDSTGEPYGPVTYPPLAAGSHVTCPNGDNAVCDPQEWQLSSNWTTTFCNQTGTSEVMWQKPPCGTSPQDLVQFADPNLESCILQALPGNPSSITVETAAVQQQVICAGRGIQALGGLESFTGLQVLDLTGNQITQFGLTFPELQQLKIGANQLTQLDLSNMDGIVWLDASDNQLASLTGLADVYFQVLDVSNNQLGTVDISTQTNLRSADLSNNKITSVTDAFNQDLSQLRELTYLDLSFNQLSDIGALTSIAQSFSENRGGQLTTLFLACNPAFACSSLELDGTYPAYQTSECADFNSASNSWVPNTHPNCPTAN